MDSYHNSNVASVSGQDKGENNVEQLSFSSGALQCAMVTTDSNVNHGTKLVSVRSPKVNRLQIASCNDSFRQF